MIDWFASKLGLLVFVIGTMTVLTGFFFMQSDVMEASKKASVASDIARLIDSVSEGAQIIYEPGLGSYTLSVKNNFLNIDGIVRYFLSTADPASITGAAKLKIFKESGRVKVVVI